MPRPTPVTSTVRRGSGIDRDRRGRVSADAGPAHVRRAEVDAVDVAVRARRVAARHHADARVPVDLAAFPEPADAVAVLDGASAPLLDRVALAGHRRILPRTSEKRLAVACPEGELCSTRRQFI